MPDDLQATTLDPHAAIANNNDAPRAIVTDGVAAGDARDTAQPAEAVPPAYIPVAAPFAATGAAGPVSGAAPIRGAIRTQIQTSTESISAGDRFSIFVTVQNPFEVPLKLGQISSHIPTELYDLQQGHRQRQLDRLKKERSRLHEGATGQPGIWRRIAQQFTSIKSVSFGPFSVNLGDELTPAVATEIASAAPRRHERTTRDEDPTQLGDARKQRRILDIEDDIATLENDGEVVRTLQPGNSTTRAFTLCTRRRVWFNPSTYRLQIEVEYEIGGITNVDTIEHKLQVKASILSVILGSLIGAFCGWATKSSGDNLQHFGLWTSDAWGTWVSLLVAIVLAAMTVVLFARKKDVQPLISVEDFWGGIAMGFLVGYVGPSVIDTALPGGAAAPPPAT